MSCAMSAMRLLLGLAAAGLAAGPVRADPAPDCTLHEVAVLSTVPTANGTIVVPARIDGHVIALEVDTGAVRSEISASVAASLGLPVRSLRRGAAFDVLGRPVDRATFDRVLEIGMVRVEHMPILVATHALWDGTGIAGLLGPDVLRGYDLELDPAAGRVALYRPDHCPGRVVYWSRSHVEVPLEIASSGHIFLSMTLDGQALRAVLDTGAGVSVLNLDVARRRFGLDTDAPGMVAVDPGGAVPHYRYPFKTLAMEGISINHPRLDILPNRARLRPDPDGHPLSEEPNGLPDLLLGMATLRRLHLYIAYGEHRLYATDADAH